MTMHLKSSKGCRLAIGAYPHFVYDARGGGGEAVLSETNESTKKSIRFCPKSFQIPSLTWKNTKFLGLPLPPGIRIHISMHKLEGNINQSSGEISLNFEANFNLEIFSIFKFPNLIVKSLLNTGKVKTNYYQSEGLVIQKNGKMKIVGVAKIEKTKNHVLNKLLFLPTEAFAELKCEIV